MKIIIGRIGNDPTVKYAYEEMVRLLKRLDQGVFIDLRIYNGKIADKKGILWLGIDSSVEASDVDEIFIDVKNGAGIITGSNPRSVLMAVYRFFYELGYRFLYPGDQGEIIPKLTFTEADLNVFVNEKPSYRHRGVCVEGAVSYEHVKNMIEWLPKVGMNGYFMQFQTPGGFFKKIYNENPNFSFSSVDDEDVSLIWSKVEEDVKTRGLDFHAVGHGWTCEPFGIHATDWGVYEGEIPEETKEYFARIDGVRQLCNGKALNTNLCYSNPVVRNIMTDAVVDYCKKHTSVNYLHFWLADDKNNHCECDKCKEKLPADYYVIMLNELDEKLTAAGIETKIVCLVYEDLLWAPQCEKINNSDRFVLMFAPINRTYTHSFAEFDTTKKIELSPYVRNRLTMPESVEENIARLSKWQELFENSDSFNFDYHLMWDHHTDPGYYQCAKILHEDMTNLDKLGLNGMVSCQDQRVAFPTGLPIYCMAKGLWDKNSKFEDVSNEYFTATFGDDASKVENYMRTLSELFDPEYMRGEKAKDVEGITKKFGEAKEVIEKFLAENILAKENSSPYWKNLKYHADMSIRYADTVITCISTDDEEEREKAKAEFTKSVFGVELNIHEIFDAVNFVWSYRKYLAIVEKL